MVVVDGAAIEDVLCPSSGVLIPKAVGELNGSKTSVAGAPNGSVVC
jgi:hypothetical protein